MYTFDTYKYFIIFAFNNFEDDINYSINYKNMLPKIR